MNQQYQQQLDQKTIEMLKAARNQVVRADKSRVFSRDIVSSGKDEAAAAVTLQQDREVFEKARDKSRRENKYKEQNPAPTPVSSIKSNKPAPLETHNKELNGHQPSKNITDKFLTGFAEEFVQKLASIEREKAAVDEEMANMEKLWSSLTEKKKRLETRRNELIKVKDKLKELDKEMSDTLKA